MFGKTKKQTDQALQLLAAVTDEADEHYEYCVFFDVATDSHVMTRRKMFGDDGQNATMERWSGQEFIKIAA